MTETLEFKATLYDTLQTTSSKRDCMENCIHKHNQMVSLLDDTFR